MATSISGPSQLFNPFEAENSISVERLKRLFSADLTQATLMGPKDRLTQFCSGSGNSKQKFLLQAHMLLHHSVCFIYKGDFDLPNEYENDYLEIPGEGLTIHSEMELGLKHKFKWLEGKLQPDAFSRLQFHEFPDDKTQTIFLDGEILMQQTLEEQFFTARIQNKDLFFHIMTLAELHAKAHLKTFNVELTKMGMQQITAADLGDLAQRDGNLLLPLIHFYFSTSPQAMPVKDLLNELDVNENTVGPLSEHFESAMLAIQTQCKQYNKLSEATALDRSEMVEKRKMAFMSFLAAYLAYQQESESQTPLAIEAAETVVAEQDPEIQSFAKEALMSLHKQYSSTTEDSLELSVLSNPEDSLSQSVQYAQTHLTSLDMRKKLNALSEKHRTKTEQEKPRQYHEIL
ncbi:hypothetical protein SOPP22_01895 [Shewanella sp. OPT22]|nr:hypothetical protein SOPP22_01895 [Shewanella sp. OPT22]